MILLIWSSGRAHDCAAALEASFQQPVRVFSTLQEGCEQLRREEYASVVLDQGMLEADAGEADQLFRLLGTATPVVVNFAVSGLERVIRELRAACQRSSRESTLYRHNARIKLRNDLKNDVTALLLSCGIALQETGLSDGAIARLTKIEDIANQIRSKLVPEAECESPAAAFS